MRDSFSSRAICLIDLPRSRCSRRIRAIVSTISIPSPPARAKAGSRSFPRSGGQFWTPITPKTGSLFPRRNTRRPTAGGSGGYHQPRLLGQYVELEQDIAFTFEYSSATAWEAIHRLLKRGPAPPPVYQGQFDPKGHLRGAESLSWPGALASIDLSQASSDADFRPPASSVFTRPSPECRRIRLAAIGRLLADPITSADLRCWVPSLLLAQPSDDQRLSEPALPHFRPLADGLALKSSDQAGAGQSRSP